MQPENSLGSGGAMIRRFFLRFGLILFMSIGSWFTLFQLGLAKIAAPISLAEPPARGAILLVPLDSRPPCTEYVVKLARMAGFQVVLPPNEMLDDYHRPANKTAIAAWLLQHASQADAAIISVDMLLHGGLLASRQELASPAEIEKTIAVLLELHQRHPQLKLYAFSILPRLLIADNPNTEKYKQAMADWSSLQETATTFENPKDIQRLAALEASIPAEMIARYRKLYDDNRRVNQQLISLTQSGVLAGLLLGQDDSAPFGLGNMEKQRLENLLDGNPTLHHKIFITRGTDEAALTLLSPAIHSSSVANRKAFIHYTEPHAANTIMPYMPRPLARTVDEKLRIAAVESVTDLSAADYILVIHAGNRQSEARHLSAEAKTIQSWLETGRQVAIVDLATDWTADQTLLPYLRRNGVLEHQLLAYAGWNTASNSVGTAVTQAAMALYGRDAADLSTVLFRETTRVTFIAERILDDWYYQKTYRHQLNDSLLHKGIDPYGLTQSRKEVEKRIRQQLNGAFFQYIHNEWRNSEISLSRQKNDSYVAGTWQIRSGLPWDRTFEIYVDLHMSPARVLYQ